jgi:hypothetical protein
MVFTPQQISMCVVSCDERIASIQDKLSDWKVYSTVLGLATTLYEKEEDKAVFKMKDKNAEKMRNYENNIQLIKVEKLVYQTLGKGARGVVFSKLFQKYSDLMANSYDISGNMVRFDEMEEQEYLEYCASSLKQREYIQRLCLYGENR